MIGITMIAGTLVLAQYGYGSQPTASYQNPSGRSIDTAPFVQLQSKCFDDAVGETQDSTQEVRQERYDTCFALHVAMVKHATAKLSEKEAASVKRELDRALQSVEKKYAKKMGATMPSEAQ